jgi:uncharacterized protein YjiK
MKLKLITTGVLLAVLLSIFSNDIGSLFASAGNKEVTKHAGQNTKGKSSATEVTIVQQWNLPEELNEVSGIAWMAAHRFACVQDEEGYIFVYNTAAGSIENKIRFAGPGDYEGITLAGSTAFVVRSDGMLYEVANFTSAQPKVASYKTPLTAEHNIEGLTFDKKNNRLLLAVKDGDLSGAGDQKGVYSFSLDSKKLNTQPVYIVPAASAPSGGKKGKSIRPSAIGIHPQTGHHFIVDGPKARLVELDGSGKLVAVKELGAAFAQPEGITFDPAGRLFISNERGKKTPANIMEVSTGTN